MSNSIVCFCEHFGIKKKVAANYHPQTNGKAKQVIHVLKKSVKKLGVTLAKDWITSL